ncbi:hypothetical protein [Streptomyces sp. SAS_270]|uniref:hypothetical protein n=1 Tax=Streptomyces sp. SAS_270 TaxID=3412748 RepID=UPI00403D3EB5
MSLSAAWPGAGASAALRVMRTAAGRHALQLVLLAGGLFLLGLVCGGQAYAADSTGATVPAVATPTGVVRSVAQPVTRSVTAVSNAAEHVVKPPVERTADTSVRRQQAQVQAQAPGHPGAGATDTVRDVVRPGGDPVGDLVETVTGGPTGPGADVLPSLSSLPTPTLPELPTPPLPTPPLPTPPDLPGLPGVPGLPSLPDMGQTLPAPAAAQPSDGTTAGRGSAHGTTVAASGSAPVSGPAPVYGPRARSAEAGGAAVGGGSRRARIAQAPAHQAPAGEPTGDPAGALGNQSAVDNGAPRHGDPQAVTLNHLAPLRLAPGAPAGVTAAETRDRYRDIPVFPG